jgi:transcriptional regulator with XRE-family HTH domain
MTRRQFRAFRRHVGWTQEQTAASAGVSRQTLIWYENGTRASDKTIEKLEAWAESEGASFTETGRLILPA